MADNNWKLFGDERLPPAIFPFYSYEYNSWSGRPIQYNQYKPIDTPMTLSHDYYNYIQAEKKLPRPLITMRGGLSEVDIQALEDDTLRFPDIKSQTAHSQAILAMLESQMMSRNMIPKKVVY